VVLEGLAVIDKDHGHLVIVFLLQRGMGIDIYLAPLEVGPALRFGQSLLHHVAQVTPFAGIHHHVMHTKLSGRSSTRYRLDQLRAAIDDANTEVGMPFNSRWQSSR
jgi:hypothetical protein